MGYEVAIIYIILILIILISKCSEQINTSVAGRFVWVFVCFLRSWQEEKILLKPEVA